MTRMMRAKRESARRVVPIASEESPLIAPESTIDPDLEIVNGSPVSTTRPSRRVPESRRRRPGKSRTAAATAVADRDLFDRHVSAGTAPAVSDGRDALGNARSTRRRRARPSARGHPAREHQDDDRAREILMEKIDVTIETPAR
jgi:hypothetical protein